MSVCQCVVLFEETVFMYRLRERGLDKAGGREISDEALSMVLFVKVNSRLIKIEHRRERLCA